MPKISYRFIPIPQRLFESIMFHPDPHVQRLALFICRIMFCNWIKELELDIYEIKTFGIPQKKVLETIEKIKDIGWFEVDIKPDNKRASFKKPSIIQTYNDHLNPIIADLLSDSVNRNIKRNKIKEEKETQHGKSH